MIKTRVFEYAREYGYDSDAELARAMDISKTHLSNVKSGERQPGSSFIEGAFRAFPDKTFDDLFKIESDESDTANQTERSKELVAEEVI